MKVRILKSNSEGMDPKIRNNKGTDPKITKKEGTDPKIKKVKYGS